MRAVLKNSVRPRLGHTPSNLPFGRGVPTRKTVFPASPRRLTFCDAFTILLAPVFTAAFVVDITQKDRKRQEWDQRLAQLLGEIEVLKERESRSWKRLQSRSVQVGVAHQRRSYSTTATAVARAYDEDGISPTITKIFPSEHLTNLQNYENLLATKVGLQLLLHICTARDPTSKLSMEGLSDGTVIPDSMEALIAHLRRVNNGLHKLAQQLPSGAADDLLSTDERRELDQRVAGLTWECRTGNIGVNELIYGYTHAVMRSRTGLSLCTYRNLVETFSTLDADALTFIAMFPYLNTRQILSDRTVASIINQYGKIKDAGRLDSFLQKLLQPEKSFQTATRWEPIVVNGVRVPIPTNRRPRLLDILVRTALQVDQPHKARAWATLLMQQEISVRRMASLFNNFLTYCAKHLNWRFGQMWIQRAIAWAALFAKESPATLPKLIFRMLDLCRCCDQQQLYDDILNAAVVAGLDVPPVDETRPDSFANQARRIRREWRLRLKQNRVSLGEGVGALEAAATFQTEMSQIDPGIQNFIGITTIDRLRTLTETRERQSDQSSSDATHSISPDEILSSTLPLQIQGSFEPWKEGNLPHPDGGLATPQSNHHGDDRSKSGLEIQLLKLREAYNSLSKRYKRQAEVNREVQNLVSIDQPYIQGGDSNDNDLQELAQKLLKFQERDTQHADHISYLEGELESLRAKASDLLTRLEASEEKEAELVKLNSQFEAQINAVKPKSLEHVFLERENYNMRFELRELTARFADTLTGKEYAQREASTLRAQYERLEEQSVTKMDSLRQERKALQKELESTDMQYQKLIQDSKAREGNLIKLLTISEERARSLRTELSKLKQTSQPSPRAAQPAKGLHSREDGQDDTELANQKERISFKFLQG